VNSVKVPFAGSYFKERYERLSRAFASHSNIHYVIFNLDYRSLSKEKDTLSDYDYPDYLYDDNLLNDVQYVFNKSILVEYTLPVIEYTWSGQTTTDFDSYANWMDNATFGADIVLSEYNRPEKSDTVSILSEEERVQIQENLEQNIMSLAVENPDTEFYAFIPPYSIVYWDWYSQKGTLIEELERWQYAVELLLTQPNIHIFSFWDCFEIICNLDNYKDDRHYSEEINEKMLTWMKEGEHEITTENLKQYLQTVEEFYTTYPYDDLFVS
jgi:Fe-S-cluster formation regulator IscX/YfhJ